MRNQFKTSNDKIFLLSDSFFITTLQPDSSFDILKSCWVNILRTSATAFQFIIPKVELVNNLRDPTKIQWVNNLVTSYALPRNTYFKQKWRHRLIRKTLVESYKPR